MLSSCRSVCRSFKWHRLVSHHALRTNKVHVIYSIRVDSIRLNHTRRRTGRVGKVVESTSDREHKRGRRFITIFLFSVASRFRNEEGSCYLVSSVQCANPSDRQARKKVPYNVPV